jgi:hypothetical protein
MCSAGLQPSSTETGPRVLALDGKTLKGSFDHFTDRKAAKVLHAFDTGSNLLLAHLEISEKSNPSSRRIGRFRLIGGKQVIDLT